MNRIKFPHPALSAFLVRTANANGVNAPSIVSGWPSSRNPPSDATVFRWFQQPTRITKVNAEILLDVLNCRNEWELLCQSGAHFRDASNVYNYECDLGLILEWNLTDWNNQVGDMSDLAQQLVKIDSDLFIEHNTSNWPGSPENWATMLSYHPDTWRVFVRNAGSKWEVVGYWMFNTPTDDWFARSCLGDYPEDIISPETCKSICDIPINIYGPAIYCRKDITGYQRNTLGSRLLLSFLYNITRLQAQGRKFDRICVPVLSKEGVTLAEKFALERMPEAISIRYATKMSWPRLGPSGKQLPALYFGNIPDEVFQ